MKLSLNNEEKNALERGISELEMQTGTQIVLAVIKRCDAYPEIPWKAFALGASIAGLAALFIANSFWISEALMALLAVSAVLGTGALLALLSVFFPGFARLFLQRHRTEMETKQYAESLFLSRQLSAASHRRSVLLLIGLFERQIVILPDIGLAGQFQAAAIEPLIHTMRLHLKGGWLFKSLEIGLNTFKELIPGGASSVSPGNKFPNTIIEEQGA